MAFARLLFISSLWASTPIVASAASLNLSNDITKSVPSCALSCFQNFVNNNFSPISCGATPSLQCICSIAGSSGYTVGEGAVACIVEESNSGTCGVTDSGTSVIARAYTMCAGQPSAAPETHPTIVATSVVPTTVSPVVQPTDEPPTTLLTATRPPSVTATSSRPTLSATNSAVSSGPVASESPTGQATTNKQLSNGQIAGIIVGIAVALFLPLVLFLCLRRRRQKVLAGANPSRFSKLRDSWSFGRRSESSPHMLQISNPLHLERQEMDFARPPGQISSYMPAEKQQQPNFQPSGFQPSFQPGQGRSSFRPDAIGLALSPETRVKSPVFRQPPPAAAVQPQTAQRMLAPPRLTLSIPTDEPQPQLQLPRQKFTGRESVLTEFAEDDEYEESAAGGNLSAQIWRPPMSADPMSASTYYVADKWGNWVLGNKKRTSMMPELEGSSPLTQSEAEKHTIAQATKAAALPKISLSMPMPMPMPKPQPPLPPPPPPEKPQPAMLGPPIQFTTTTTRDQSSSAASSIYSSYSLPITLAPGPENPMPPPEAYQKLANENPSKWAKRKSSRGGGLGRSDSAVSERSVTTIASSTAGDGEYDIIDPDQPVLSPVVESPLSPLVVARPGIRPASVQRTPDKLSLFPSPLRPGGGLGLGLATTHSSSSPSSKPKPNHSGGLRVPNPNPNRNPGQIRTGSPNFPQTPPQQRPQQQQQPPSGGRALMPNTAYVTPPSDPRSAQPSSSLLSKRLGPERAATLALSPNDARPTRSLWERDPARRDPDGRPLPTTPSSVAQEPLKSPMWQPKLTPSRRGDDLFLNVQVR